MRLSVNFRFMRRFLQRSVNVLVLTWETVISMTGVNADWIFYFDLPPNYVSYIISQKHGNCDQNEHYFFVEQCNGDPKQEIEPFVDLNIVLQEVRF